MCVPLEGRCGLGLLLPVFSLVIDDFSPLSDLDFYSVVRIGSIDMVRLHICVGLLRLGSLDCLRFVSDSKFGPQPGFGVASPSGGWFNIQGKFLYPWCCMGWILGWFLCGWYSLLILGLPLPLGFCVCS